MPPVVVLDACVLYPASQRDFFMWLAARGVIRAYWTNEIHDEWMRNVERDYGIARSVLERVRKLMDRAAGDAVIRHYRQHEQLFAKTDAKDRHVAAAAVAARKRSRADVVTIITWNLKDFDRRELAKVGVAAETPDTFLCRLFTKSPEEVITALVRMQNNLRNPSKTVRECTDTLATQGLKNFAELISGVIN
jgi:hypothetical protein